MIYQLVRTGDEEKLAERDVLLLWAWLIAGFAISVSFYSSFTA